MSEPFDNGAGAGSYPPPPPPPAYGGGQATPDRYSPTDALGYGWRKFVASPATLLVPMIVVLVVLVVVSVLIEFLVIHTIAGTHACTRTVFNEQVRTQCGPGFFVRAFAGAIASGLIFLVWQILAAGLYKGALNVVDGKPFSVGQLFDGFDKTQVVIAGVLVAIGVAIGSLLCYFPGLIVGFLTQFTLFFVVDKQMGAVDAIRASVSMVTQHLGDTILWYILAAVVSFVGAILCGVGLLVAAPVVLIGFAYTYRRLQHEPVTP